MNNQPLVSILIVAYNPGDYLTNTLSSCLNQSYQNTEILLLDNNSSEDIRKYISQAEQTTKKTWKITPFFEKTNHGPYKGLNFLLERANWHYIAIQDHDDIWHLEKLEKQVNFLETHPDYVWCGTKTIMYYEADKKYFEYFLGDTNYYTIHPSLMFRNNGKFRYNITETEYMCDSYALKYNLCNGEKKICNLDESLTTHIIKASSSNYSYRWYTLSFKNLKRAYEIHSIAYATLTTGWEIMRKLVYPALMKIQQDALITKIERIPFILFWNMIQLSKETDWWR
mgnify:FL=1